MLNNPLVIIMRSSAKTLIGVLMLIISLSIIYSCRKDVPTPPVLTTIDPTEITQTTVTTGGNITSDGGASINIAGVCWSTSSNPTLKEKHTNNTKLTGIFSVTLTELIPNTKYYIRAYANNDEGTAYGNEVSFTTSQIVLPEITTEEVTSLTAISAMSGGNISSDGGDPVSARGVCWSKDPGPTTDDFKTTDGTGNTILSKGLRYK